MTEATHVRRGILLVTAAALFDTALSFLMPIVLSRLVPVEEFGQYRLFWLVVATLVAFVPLGLEQAMIYFVVRTEGRDRLRVIGNTLLYFNAAALIAALLVAPWNSYIAVRLDHESQLILCAFCFLYLGSLPLDYLPLAHQRTIRHATHVVIGAVVRVSSILLSAMLAGSIKGAFYGMLLFASVRLVLLFSYLRREFGHMAMPVDIALLKRQLAYGVPFGVAGALYTFRIQAEQWLVSTLFAMKDFAVYSVALLMVLAIQVLQQPVARVLQPRIQNHGARGNWAQAHALNQKMNVTVGFVVYPIIMFAFVFADKIFELLFPSEYAPGANVMRVYLLAQGRLGIEGTTLLQALGEGRFAMILAIVLLPVIVLLSWYGGTRWGLPAAAAGSVGGTCIEILFVQFRLAKRLTVPFSAVQSWGAHARLLAMGGLASGAAFLLTSLSREPVAPFSLLAVAFLVALATYLALAVPFGMRALVRDVMPWRSLAGR